jgi:hypothetical protein
MNDAKPSQPRIDIHSERETAKGWSYAVVIHSTQPDQLASQHAVTLSWVDHDYWCGGRDAPSTTVERVLTAFASSGLRLPRRIDCSTLRRLYPELDAALNRSAHRSISAA